MKVIPTILVPIVIAIFGVWTPPSTFIRYFRIQLIHYYYSWVSFFIILYLLHWCTLVGWYVSRASMDFHETWMSQSQIDSINLWRGSGKTGGPGFFFSEFQFTLWDSFLFIPLRIMHWSWIIFKQLWVVQLLRRVMQG